MRKILDTEPEQLQEGGKGQQQDDEQHQRATTGPAAAGRRCEEEAAPDRLPHRRRTISSRDICPR